MDNGPRGPILGGLFAIVLGLAAVFFFYYRGGQNHFVTDYTTSRYIFVLELNAFEITLVGLALTLGVYSAIGLFSYFLDGPQVHIGRSGPQLTDGTAAALGIFSVLTAASAVVFAIGVVQDWGRLVMGLSIGLGFVFAAFVLGFFKQGFVGEEGRFDEREDGVPW